MQLQSASFVLAATLLVAACAAPEGKYPSLAIRDAERQSIEMAAPSDLVAVALPPAPASSGLRQQIAQLAGAADAAHDQFLRYQPALARRVRAGRSARLGSPSWADALVAMGELDSLRTNTAAILSEMDVLWAQAEINHEGTRELNQVVTELSARLAQQDATIAALHRARTK